MEKELLKCKQELRDTKAYYEDRIADLEARIARLQSEKKRWISEFESCNASNLNGTSLDEFKEVALNMKLPVPVNKKPLLQIDYEPDPFAQTNQIGKEFNSTCSRMENISILSGEQAALMAKEQLQRNIKG